MKDKTFIQEALTHISLAAAELPCEADQYADEEHRMLYSEIMFLMRLCHEYVEVADGRDAQCFGTYGLRIDPVKMTAEEIVEHISDYQLAKSQGLLLTDEEKEMWNQDPRTVAEMTEELKCRGTDCDAVHGVGHSQACEDEHHALTFGPLSDSDFAPVSDYVDTSKGYRKNGGKPQLSMILEARVSLIGCARVLEFGAVKYARGDWRKGLDMNETMDSLLRHVAAYMSGEYLDPESGLPHIDHIHCNALFLGEHTNRETGDGRL